MFTQSPDREAGDIAPEWGPWVRYDDPEARTFKLNVERQNGRAAMLGRAAACLESYSTGQSICASIPHRLQGVWQGTLMWHMTLGFHFLSFDQDLHWWSSGHLLLTCRQASRASSCTSSWAWMGSTRRVASRPGPLRRPSSKHEARAARPYHWESPSAGASRIESGRAGEVYRTSGASEGS